MKKILFLTLIAGALLFSASCQREGVLYDFPQDAALLSFPNKKISFEMSEEDGNKVVVQLYRGNTKGAVSVPFEFEDASGKFTPAKNTFDFADGEGVASVDITYSSIEDFGPEAYGMKMSIDEEQVSPSGVAELAISARRALTLKFVGQGKWTSGFLSTLFEEDASWPQDLYTTEEYPNLFIMPDCWVEGFNFMFNMVDGVPVWAELVDTGLTVAEAFDNDAYASLGDFWLLPGECSIENGVMTLMTDVIFLPEVDGGTSLFEMETPEIFVFPKGVEL